MCYLLWDSVSHQSPLSEPLRQRAAATAGSLAAGNISRTSRTPRNGAAAIGRCWRLGMALVRAADRTAGKDTPRPSDVAGLIVTMRRDGAAVVIDMGAASKSGLRTTAYLRIPSSRPASRRSARGKSTRFRKQARGSDLAIPPGTQSRQGRKLGKRSLCRLIPNCSPISRRCA
jgi:hypothetical protein